MKSSALSKLLAVMMMTCVSYAGAQALTSGDAKNGSKALASMGSIAVMQDELAAMLHGMPPQSQEQLKSNPATIERWLVSRLASEALLAQAQQQKWTERPEVKQAIDSATREIVMRSYLASVSQVPESYPSEAELQSAYDENKGSFQIPRQVQVAQIYLAASASDSEAMKRVKKQAEDLARKAKEKGSDFGALAKQHSQDTRTAAQGGDVGMMPVTQLLPEIRTAVATLKKGEVSPVIQTESGFHVLKMIDEKAPQIASLVQVKDQLRALLRQQRQAQLQQAYLQGLIDAGKPTIDTAAVQTLLNSAK